MSIYYKAVRPDGTDFHTGDVDYASLCGTGESLPVLPTKTHPRCCSGDVYRASTEKGEAFIGGTWPCRLFEVEGDEIASAGSKRSFYTLKVVRELPAYEALGPNGREVAEFIERIPVVVPKRLEGIVGPGDAEDDARDTAWRAAWDAAWGAKRHAALSARFDAQSAVWRVAGGYDWDADRYAAWQYAGQDADWCIEEGSDWAVLGIAAWHAAAALVVKDLISDEVFDTLYSPWKLAMEGLKKPE